MLIRKIKYPIHYLGPGERICLWTMGCSHHCNGCVAENLWPFEQKYEMSISEILTSLHQYPGRPGLTFSGGDPFMQEDFLALLKALKDDGYYDIFVYTGYTLEEILANAEHKQLLAYIDVLIDGRYEEELNDNLPLRGSSNQRMIILNAAMEQRYRPLLEGERQYEIDYDEETLNIYGVVPRGFVPMMKEFKQNIIKKGEEYE